MKLNEIANNDKRRKVIEKLHFLGHRDEYFSVDEDGKVHYDGCFNCRTNDRYSQLPFEFANITENLDLDDLGLTTLKGCPPTLPGGYFSVMSNKLTSFEYAPSEVCGSVYAYDNCVKSLKGIEKIFKKIGSIFAFDDNKIEEGGIGLLLIEGLRELNNGRGVQLIRPFQIINGYLQGSRNVYECQAELIDEGFEEFAQL